MTIPEILMLAQFREKRAYPFVVKTFGAPGETPFGLAGDTVTERLSRIFASLYDGDPAPLQGLVDPWFADLESIERVLREREQGRREKGRVITDAIAETKRWASFGRSGKRSARPAQGRQPDASAAAIPSQPKAHKKPWRNAPCPCGSGKKYKHCWGKAQSSAADPCKP
ncbi:MAG: DUF1186 domain-containing protein [Limisphaerales bacterium]